MVKGDIAPAVPLLWSSVQVGGREGRRGPHVALFVELTYDALCDVARRGELTGHDRGAHLGLLHREKRREPYHRHDEGEERLDQ